MSAALHRRRTGRAASRAPFFTVVLTLLLGCLLTHPGAAHGQTDDAAPTWWHEASGLTPLLTAPPPPSPATICLIDTGVTPTPDVDISARWAYDGGTLDDVRATDDSPGHGTLVAHFAAGAVNGWGGAGAFPHARISSVRVFPREGGASWREYIAAISRCSKLDPNTKVIVISIGGQEIAPGEADELEAHIEQARNLYGVNVVAAAGNGGGAIDFPARFAAAVAVAGLTSTGGYCEFSARGPEVDIAAPGCGVTTAGASGEGWLLDGTSFAAPIVAGALAAIRAYAPALTAREAEGALLGAARGDSRALDAAAALAAAGAAHGARRESVQSPRRTPPLSAALGAAPLPVIERLPRPRVRARWSRRGVLLIALNRPPRTALEVRAGARRVRRRTPRVWVRTGVTSVRCRFVRGTASSHWTTVRS